MKKIILTLFICFVILFQNLEANAKNTTEKTVNTTTQVNKIYNPSDIYDYSYSDLKIKPIKTTVYSNIKYNYHFYIPEILKHRPSSYPLIVWVQGYNIDSSTGIPSGLYDLANKKGYAILSPNFMLDISSKSVPNKGDYIKVFLDMLLHAKANGLNYSKIYIAGYGNGAEFAYSFASEYPNMTVACALLNMTSKITPLQSGNNIKYFVATGKIDSAENLTLSQNFLDYAKMYKIPVTKKEYETNNQLIPLEILDVAEFFEKTRMGLL